MLLRKLDLAFPTVARIRTHPDHRALHLDSSRIDVVEEIRLSFPLGAPCQPAHGAAISPLK